MSTAGAMDRQALAHANLLVHNAPDEAAIEFTLLGGSFVLVDGPALLAVSGPGASLSIGGRAMPHRSAGRAEAGDTVRVGDARGGVYVYLAIAGGTEGEPAMGSRSVHRRSGIGGRPLLPGDRIVLRSWKAAERDPRIIQPPEFSSGPMRVILGPQDEEFEPESVEQLLSEPYRILPQSDRMGCRLEGRPLVHLRGHNIVSDGVLPGSIQVPGNGQPLVLFRDCPTTGGYPKIANVISADLDRLAQTLPGTSVRFSKVSLEEAVAAAQALHQSIRRLMRDGEIRRIVSSEDLLRENLIDGVFDAGASGSTAERD